MAHAVHPWLLRRLRAETGAPQAPEREVWMPLCLTPVQRAAYCSVLLRNIEILTDPKPPRHAGHRAAQMRCVCTELRKVGAGRACNLGGGGAILRSSCMRLAYEVLCVPMRDLT